MPTTKALIKTFILLAVLLAANIFFGQLASQVHEQYALIFSFGSELVDFVLWIFGGILLTALVTGLSVKPIATSQKTLLLALVVIISASFALGYRADIKERGFIIPLTYRESVMKMVIPLLKSQVEKQFKLGPRESALAVREIEGQVEAFWLKAEKTLQPYAEYLPLGPGLMIFFLLETLMGLVAWIVPSVLRLLFPLLNLIRLTRVVVETKEARRVTLE